MVHDAPFDPKVDKLSSGAAFVCVDIREPFDHELSYSVSSIAALAPKINRGGCVIIVGSAEQVCFQTIVFRYNFASQFDHVVCNACFYLLARSNSCHSGTKTRDETEVRGRHLFQLFCVGRQK